MEKINPRLKQAEEHAFFFKCDPDVHGGGVGKGEGRGNKWKKHTYQQSL